MTFDEQEDGMTANEHEYEKDRLRLVEELARLNRVMAEMSLASKAVDAENIRLRKLLTSPGSSLIADERRRQQEGEGFDAKHDDVYVNDELACAAYCYLQAVVSKAPQGLQPWRWPWSRSWWKPCKDDPIHNLVKAGALIAAEIDRRIRKVVVL